MVCNNLLVSPSVGMRLRSSASFWNRYSTLSSPHYSDKHRKLRQVAREYHETHLAPYAAEWEAQGTVPRDVVLRHAQLG